MYRNGTLMVLTALTNIGTDLGISYKQIACSTFLAAHHVRNGDNSVVPNLHALTGNLDLSLEMYDTQMFEQVAIRGYLDGRSKGARALIGAQRSAVSMPLALLSGIDQIPQCSFWSSSPSLSNKLLYPYFGRTFPSDAVTALAVPGLLRYFGWASIGVVHVNDAYANAYAEGLRENAPEANVRVVATASFEANTKSTYGAALEVIKSAAVRYRRRRVHTQPPPTPPEASAAPSVAPPPLASTCTIAWHGSFRLMSRSRLSSLVLPLSPPSAAPLRR